MLTQNGVTKRKIGAPCTFPRACRLEHYQRAMVLELSKCCPRLCSLNRICALQSRRHDTRFLRCARRPPAIYKRQQMQPVLALTPGPPTAMTQEEKVLTRSPRARGLSLRQNSRNMEVIIYSCNFKCIAGKNKNKRKVCTRKFTVQAVGLLSGALVDTPLVVPLMLPNADNNRQASSCNHPGVTCKCCFEVPVRC